MTKSGRDGTEDGSSATRSRGLLAVFFIGAGVNHFVNPRFYEAIVPPRLHRTRPAWSSAQRRRRDGRRRGGAVAVHAGGCPGCGLIALLAAVFPANLYMASQPERFKQIPRWALLRAPAAAAADDAVGLEGDPAMKADAREIGRDAAMFG